MTYRTMFFIITVITITVLSGSIALLFFGLHVNSSGAPPYDFQGAGAISAVIPSFAGVLLAAIAVYMYVKLEDPLHRKSNEVIYNKNILMRMLDEIPSYYVSSRVIESGFLSNNVDEETARQKMNSYFSLLVSGHLQKVHELMLETSLIDALCKSRKADHIQVTELVCQLRYYGELLRNKIFDDPITRFPVHVMVCLTCEQLREVVKSAEFYSANEVYNVLKKSYASDENPYENPRYTQVFDKIKDIIGRNKSNLS